jgi:hypothetical protein
VILPATMRLRVFVCPDSPVRRNCFKLSKLGLLLRGILVERCAELSGLVQSRFGTSRVSTSEVGYLSLCTSTNNVPNLAPLFAFHTTYRDVSFDLSTGLALDLVIGQSIEHQGSRNQGIQSSLKAAPGRPLGLLVGRTYKTCLWLCTAVNVRIAVVEQFRTPTRATQSQIPSCHREQTARAGYHPVTVRTSRGSAQDRSNAA